MPQQPPVGQGHLIIEDSISHSVLHNTLGNIVWTSDQSGTETSTDNTQHSQQTDFNASVSIRTQIPSK